MFYSSSYFEKCLCNCEDYSQYTKLNSFRYKEYIFDIFILRLKDMDLVF